MIRSSSVILLITLIFLSCSGKNKVPEGILSQPKMESVLWDMISADEFVSGNILQKDPTLNVKQESLKLYEEIFLIHDINKEEFQKSLSFYQTHPSLLITVLDSLTAKHQNIPSKPRRIKLNDTINPQKTVIE